jgi:hypothetical protein
MLPGAAGVCSQKVGHGYADVEDHGGSHDVTEVDNPGHVVRPVRVDKDVERTEIPVDNLRGEGVEKRNHLLVELIENVFGQGAFLLLIDIVKKRPHPGKVLEVPEEQTVGTRMIEVLQSKAQTGTA